MCNFAYSNKQQTNNSHLIANHLSQQISYSTHLLYIKSTAIFQSSLLAGIVDTANNKLILIANFADTATITIKVIAYFLWKHSKKQIYSLAPNTTVSTTYFHKYPQHLMHILLKTCKTIMHFSLHTLIDFIENKKGGSIDEFT